MTSTGKRIGLGFLFVGVGLFGFFLGRLVDPSSVTPAPESDSGSRAELGGSQGRDSSRPRPGSARADRQEGDRKRPVDLLGQLAELSPGIGSYLFFPVVDGPDLRVNQRELEILGLTQEEGEQFQQSMQATLDEIRDQEKGVFKVVEQSDHNVVISVPGFDERKAEVFREKIHAAYLKIMPESLAKETSSIFIESNPEMFGAVLGRSRLVQITPPSDGDELLGGTKPKYRVRTVLLGRGVSHDYYRERGEDPFTAMAGRDILVEDLPGEWSHLFESE